MRTLLIIPPMADLTAPYPSTAYLAGYLASKGHDVTQWDSSLEVFLTIHTQTGMRRIGSILSARQPAPDAA